MTRGGGSEGSRCSGAEVARTCAGLFLDVKQEPASARCVLFMLPVLPQGQRGRLGSRATRDHFGVMEEGEAEGEGPVAVREAPSQASTSQQSTTTNLLASVKEQVPPAAPFTPLIDPTGIG